MAYRTADYQRYQQFDFIVGVEVRPSETNHPVPDICDQLQGRYPKGFKFVGWHPHCRCIATSILDLSSEPQQIENTPKQFNEWVLDNAKRIETADKRGTTPYFVRDNRDAVEKALKKKKKTPQQIADERHTTANSGIAKRERAILGKQAKEKALKWVETLPQVTQPNGTISYQKVIGHITLPGKTFINETYSKNLHNKELCDVLEAATHAEEWIPRARLIIKNEIGKHHPYSFNVYEVEYNGRIIQFKTKCIPGEPIYTMKLKK